ncbi:MAG: hypothetical protein R2717_07745 [Schumannella sp.]
MTAIRDCGDRDFATLAVRDEIRRGELAGPVMLAAAARDHPRRTPHPVRRRRGPWRTTSAAVDRLGATPERTWSRCSRSGGG